jgi:hypothetical protein
MYNSSYGLIRSEVLRRTRLLGLFPGADNVLLAELAMLGMLAEVPEPLLRIRKHPGRSFTVNKTLKQLREVFNPGQGNKFSPLGLWGRIHLELVRSALLMPLEPHDRVLCFAVALMVPQYWTFRGFLGKQKRRILLKLSLKGPN